MGTEISSNNVSIIIPAKNEAAGLKLILPTLKTLLKDAEIIVINDGSTDNTAEVCQSYSVDCKTHPYSMGNGAAIKTGARAANREILICMDADGQHQPQDVSRLIRKLSEGYDMVVGARGASGQANFGRLAANSLYNKLASWIVDQKVLDLTSGFRAVRTQKFKEYIHLLPNGFSYPTTITMSFFRAGYPIAYEPIRAQKREGKSHIKPLRDGVRFFLIIFKVGTLYSPLKLFLPISLAHFALGLGYYAFTYISAGRFTNMSALLLTTAVIIFLIGLVSEQITTLIFQQRERK